MKSIRISIGQPDVILDVYMFMRGVPPCAIVPCPLLVASDKTYIPKSKITEHCFKLQTTLELYTDLLLLNYKGKMK